MKESLRFREVLTDARRVVVKIGSRVLIQKSGRPDVRRMRSIATQVAAMRRDGRDVIIVTSGAVGAGMEALGMDSRPDKLPDQQMCAAVGQARLMTKYGELLGKHGVKVGQVLLTHGDFRHKIRCTNARRTLENLLRHGVVPIVNENDVVADEEIKADMTLGDNDYLGSLVANLLRADLLVLLTTVDGLREPGAADRTRRVRYLETVNRKAYALVNGGPSALSKGGMATKLKAAESVSKAGGHVVIANGRKDGILTDILAGCDVGTIVVAN